MIEANMEMPTLVMTKLRIEIFRSKINQQWYFNIRSTNGKLIAQSEGYKTRHSCRKTAGLIASTHVEWKVVPVEE
jgi:uncharacterized protein YegP (UPF0339 family)